MSGTGSWLQFANRMNKFKGSYFQDFADISGDIIVRNTGNVYLHAGSNMYMTAGDISMNGYIYCKGVVDLSGNSLSGGGDGGGGGLTSLSTVGVKSINTTDFMTTGGYATVGGYLNVTGSTTLNGPLTMNSASTFNGQLDGSGGSFNSLSVGTIELRGDIIPDTNITYDIGSADNKFRDLYVSESSIWVGDNNKMAVENNKITMKRRKRGDTDIPKFIRDKISFPNLSDKITHVKTFASTNSLGKTSSDLLSTYTVTDWIRFANKKAQLGQDGFTKTNHTGSDIYDLTADFDNDDSGQWSTISTGAINYDGKITVGTSETIGKATILGNVAIGGYSSSNADLYVNGNTVNSGALEVNGITYLSTTNIGASLTVSQNTNITGKLGVGKSADGTHHLDVLGTSRVQNDAYFRKSLLIGTGVNTTSLADNNATGASMYIETPLVAGVYPDIPHNVVINVPNTVFKAKDNSIITNTNYLEIDATSRSILPYVKDANGNLVNSGMTNGWELGGPGAYRFDKIHARDINISTETINIEDASGNKIGMSFDATTGSVNYTVVTKDTADASGETFVIKGVQTQKISSGGGTIDPALLEFTGLSFGDTFDSTFAYDLSTTYTYNLTTTTYTGDGISTFTSSAGAQGLSSFVSANNIATLLGDIPTKKSSVIRVGVDNRADGGLDGIDTVGNKIDLTNKVVSVSDNDGGTTLKWTLWGSEAELNATTAGNYLNYIELKNINMVSGTYFVAKTAGTIVYNNITEDYLTNNDLVGVVNGDLFLYINRSPGNNWTKIPVSLPASGSITTQMLADNIIQPGKIAANAITTTKILDGAITTSKIADASITAIKFKAGEINGTIFADDAIDGAKIGGNIATSKLVGTISGVNITDDTIASSKIVDGAVTSAKIAYLGVSADNLMANSVTTAKITDGAVTASKIQDGVITSAKLTSGIINTDTLLADNVVTSSKILGGAVTDAKLATNSVTSSKIQDGSITTAKLAASSVTIDKINGSVFSGKQDTLIAGTGINIAINGLGKPVISSTVTNDIPDYSITANKLSGDITASLQSKLTAGNGINISNSNVITSYSSIPNNSVTSAMIQDGAITADKLALDITDTNSTNNTAVEGTYTGQYSEPDVNEFKFNSGTQDTSVRISSDGLLLITCNEFNTSETVLENRIRILKRDTVSSSWPDINTIGNHYKISGTMNPGNQADTIGGFDIDSSGQTLVYSDSVGYNRIYDLSKNRFSNVYEVGGRCMNTKITADGNRMCIYRNHLTSGYSRYASFDIYEVDKTNTSKINVLTDGKLFYSTTNGDSWSSIQNHVIDIKLRDVNQGNNIWMACGSGRVHTIATSTDGKIWTGKGKIFNISCYSVYHGMDNLGVKLWVAVGEDTDKRKNIQWSYDDGDTWNFQETIILPCRGYKIIYGLNKWFISSYDRRIYWSDSGVSWSSASYLLNSNSSIVSGMTLMQNAIFCASATNTTNTIFKIYLNTSNTPLVVNSATPFTTTANRKPLTNKIVWGMGIYVAVGWGMGSGIDAYTTPNRQIAYSYNLSSWKTLSIFTGVGLDIIFDSANRRFIAMGEDENPSKRIQESYDGMTWTPMYINTSEIVETTPKMITMNENNNTVYSMDNGLTWNSAVNNILHIVNKIHFDIESGLMMAVGIGIDYNVATSTDGIVWIGKGVDYNTTVLTDGINTSVTGQDKLFNCGANSVYCFGSRWIVVGCDIESKRNIQWSDDGGSTWSYPDVSFMKVTINDVIYHNDRWFLIGTSGYIYWSRDGITWGGLANGANDISGRIWSGLTTYQFKNFKILKTSGRSDTEYEYLWFHYNTSTSAVFHSYLYPTAVINSIVYGITNGYNDVFSTFKSFNNNTWQYYSVQDLCVNSTHYQNGYFICVGFGGTTDQEYIKANPDAVFDVAISSRGDNWVRKRIFTGVGYDITHDGTKWIAVGEHTDSTKRIQYSVDNGETWSPLLLSVPASQVPTDIVPLYDNYYKYSLNGGKQWVDSSNNILNISISKIHHNGFIWMAVGEGTNHNIATSTNGLDWVGKGVVFDCKCNSVYYKNGIWVAVGQDTNNRKNIQWSDDNGDTWNYPDNTILRGRCNDIIWFRNRWFVCGTGYNIYWSYDGVSWSTSNFVLVGTTYDELNGFLLTLRDQLLRFYGSNSSNTYNTSCINIDPNTDIVSSVAVNTALFGTTIARVSGAIISIYSKDIKINQMHYANGYYMCAGYGGTDTVKIDEGDGVNGCNITYSSNFVTWTRKHVFSGAGFSVTYDGTKWIATGDDIDPLKRIQYSDDNGETWAPLYTTVPEDTSVVIASTDYSPKTLAYSDSNGVWTQSTDYVLNKTNKIMKGKDMWVAVGEGDINTVATSTDGINWVGSGKLFNIRGNSVFYKGGMWVIVGEDTNALNVIQWSVDAIVWNVLTSPVIGKAYDVIYFNDRWVVCGTSVYMFWSLDGMTWSDGDTTVNGVMVSSRLNGSNGSVIFCMTQNETRLYYVGLYTYYVNYNNVSTVPLSITNGGVVKGPWETVLTTTKTMNANHYVTRQIHYANGVYMCVGFGGTTLANINANIGVGGCNISICNTGHSFTWKPKRIFTGCGLTITYEYGRWIATGEDVDPTKRIQYSDDNGETWTPYTNPLLGNTPSVSHIITRHNKEFYSVDDGINWTETINNAINGYTYSIKKGSDVWMAIGEGKQHNIATSTDGIEWIGKGKLFDIRGLSLEYHSGLWVAVGQDTDPTKNIQWSSDNGINWSNPSQSLLLEGYKVIHALGYWMIGGLGPYVYWSTNGISWNTTDRIGIANRTYRAIYNLIDNITHVSISGSSSSANQDGYKLIVNDSNPTNIFLQEQNNAIELFVSTGISAHNVIAARGLLCKNGWCVAVGSGVYDTGNIAIGASSYVNSWSRKNVFTGSGLDITSDGINFIATGEDADASKRIQYSSDYGETWSSYTLPSTIVTEVTNIITLSNVNKYAYSYNDGVTWTIADDTLFSGSMTSIYYSEIENLWMSVGEGSLNTVATSTDGINWTGRGMVFNIKGNSVFYTGGVWVAVGQDTDTTRNIAFSTDNGVTWAYPDTTLFSINGNDVTHAFGRWIVCGDGNVLYTSFDGITWDTVNCLETVTGLSTNSDVFDLLWDGQQLHLSCHDYTQVGNAFTYNSTSYYLLVDGAVNIEGTIKNTGFNKSVFTNDSTGAIHVQKTHHANSMYISVGNGGGDVSVTNNPVSTTSYTRYSLFSGHGKFITHNGANWIATGIDTDLTKRIQVSVDGSTWVPAAFDGIDALGDTDTVIRYFNKYKPSNRVEKLAYFPYKQNETSVVFGISDTKIGDNLGVKATLPPVIENTIFNYNQSPTFNIITSGKANAMCMGTGQNTMSYSIDFGVNFIGLGNSIFSVAGLFSYHNGDTWVAVGEGDTNNVATSIDGINWVGRGKIFSVRGNSVAYYEGMWIAVGEDAVSNRCIAYSMNNGVSWSYSTSSVFSTSCNCIVHTDTNGWLAGGTGILNTLASSVDGISWTGLGQPMDTSVDTIAEGGLYNLAIGGRDTRSHAYTFQYSINPTISWSGSSTSALTSGNTRVYSVGFSSLNEKWSVCYDGTSSTATIYPYGTPQNGQVHLNKNTQNIACHGISMCTGHWIAYGEDTIPQNKIKFSYNGGTNWYPYDGDISVHERYNHIAFNYAPKLVKRIADRTIISSVNAGYGVYPTIGYYAKMFKMALSGDGTTLAATYPGAAGLVRVYNIYDNASIEYNAIGDGIKYYLGKDITLNYDATVMAYSYGLSEVDSDTEQISRVVVFSKDTVSGLWNTLPDTTLKGSDFYEYSEFIPIRKFITGFGASLKIDAEGKILTVASHGDYDWCGMRVFKKRSGVWLPYFTGVESVDVTTTKGVYTLMGSVDITDNGQMIIWASGANITVVTIPNSAIYTNIKLAPLSGATAYLHIGQDENSYDSEYGLNSDWFNAVETNGRIYSYPKSSVINHSKEFALQSRNHLSFYTGISLSETPSANDNNNNNLRMYIDNTGLVGIGKKANIHQLDVSGSINASNGIYASGVIMNTSDDRLKDDEVLIENAIETIMNLRPEIYNKKQSFSDAVATTKESGLIAQDIWYKSPELRHLVKLGTKVDGSTTVTDTIKIPVNTLAENLDFHYDENYEKIYTVAGQIVSKDDIQNESKFKTVLSQYEVPNIVPVVPEDIQDYTPNDDIQTDPDYTALGWGDTPASVNYTGLIPYLVKAMQEQQGVIDQLKNEINILKNA